MSLKSIIVALLLALGTCVGGGYLLLSGMCIVPSHSLTHLSMMRILRASTDYAAEKGHFPAALGDLTGMDAEDRLDAWGHRIDYELRDDGLLVLLSRGRDREPGGEGDDRDLRYCAATRRADGTLALEGPEGFSLAFLDESEITIYEFARLAKAFDVTAHSAGVEAAAKELLSRAPVLDGWGTPIGVVAVGGLVRFESLGADGQPGPLVDPEHARWGVDRFAEQRLGEGDLARWVYYCGEPESQQAPEALLGLDPVRQ